MDDPHLTEEEFDRLADFLVSDRLPDAALEIDGLDGMFAALFCSPTLVNPSVWIPVIWGGVPPFESLEEAEEIMTLVMRHWNDVAGAIRAGEYEPVLQTGIDDKGDAHTIAHGWALGFARGMSLHGAPWWDEDNDELQTLLFPILKLVEEILDDTGTVHLDPETRRELADMLAPTVHELYDYMIEHAQPDATERALRRVGRNDPCPCGSGKKFKQCCAGGSVH